MLQSRAIPKMTDSLPTSPIDYDVFVSYRWIEPVRSWVQKQLVPALRAAGLRVCLDVNDFKPGRDSIHEMERAGKQSRRVLCILSGDNFEENHSAHFELLMARRSDVSGVDSRLIPFIFRPTSIPDWLVGLIPIDWTEKSNRGREWGKLLRALDATNLEVDPPDKDDPPSGLSNKTLRKKERTVRVRGGAYPYVFGEFHVSDGSIFFGRERDVTRILDQIEKQRNLRLLVIQGPSGVGKSSVLQAGLLYKLTRGNGRKSNQRWVFCLFRPFDPDVSPLRAMANNLPREHGRFDEPAQIAAKIEKANKNNPDALSKIVEEILLDGLDSGTRLILAVNQLEELWTTVVPDFQKPFLDFLTAAARNPRILILATIRDDHATAFRNANQISPLFQDLTASEYPLKAPLRTEIEDMVLKPARCVRPPVTFDDEAAFVDAISSDGRDLGEGSLPLISLMLQTLRQPDRNSEQVGHFTMAQYEELGKLKGIVYTLAQRADAQQNQELLGLLFENLVIVTDSSLDHKPILREVRRESLIEAAGEERSTAMRELVEKLASARLLYEHDGFIRIAYESLLDHWDELKKWRERNSWDLAILEEQRHDALLWHRRRRRPEYLKARSGRLEEIDEIIRSHGMSGSRAEDKVLRDYLRACRVRSLRDTLKNCVKSGRVTDAVAQLRALRELGEEALVREDRGTDEAQLKPAFWAAITGDDKPYDSEEGADREGASIFDGEEGKEFMSRTTSRGITPIGWAAVAGNHELVHALISKGDSSWQRVLDDGGTIVETAAVGGSLEAVSILVEESEKAGIDPFRSDKGGSTPMTWAIQEKHNHIVNYFVHKGHSFEFRSRDGFNALTEAARGDNLAILQELVESQQWDPKREIKDGWTPLHFACLAQRTNRAEVTSALIAKYDADLHAKNIEGETSLHIASLECKLGAIPVLIDAAAVRGELDKLLEAKNVYGQTPLHCACLSAKSWQAVKKLIAAGANINAIDNDGDTPLCIAVREGHYRSVQLLVDAGANTELFAKDRWPALCFAADDGDVDMVELLLKAKGVNPNVLVRPGWTPLMLAAEKGHVEVLSLLLKKGADPAFRNEFGQSVVSVAYKNGNKEIKDILKSCAQGRPDLANLIRAQEDLERRGAGAEASKRSTLAPQHVIEPDSVAEAVESLRAYEEKWGSLVDAAAALGWTRTARYLIANGSAEPALWGRPRVSDEAWFLTFTIPEIEPGSHLAAVLEALDPCLVSQPQHRRLRATELEFFPGCLLLAIEDSERPGPNEQFFIAGPAQVWQLNWKNESIYVAAENLLPQFDDDSVVLQYCLFFFHWVRGELGRFQIVEKIEQIRWTTAPSAEIAAKAAECMRPLRVVERTGDIVRLNGIVVFKNALFSTDILLAKNPTDLHDPEAGVKEHLTLGQMKLTNEELLLEDLPIEIDGPPGIFG